jgi:hypothetical protein
MSSTLFPEEQVPIPNTILGVDVYHVTAPLKFDLLLIYAYNIQTQAVFPLGVYVDNKIIYGLLYKELQVQLGVPVFFAKDIEVSVRERAGSINKVTTEMKVDKFHADLNSKSLGSGFPGETVSMPTPDSFKITVTAHPGNWACTVGEITGYGSVRGNGFNTDFKMTIYKP